MAQYKDYKQFTIETIKENLIALDFCFKYEKSEHNNCGEGMLGMPALILLSSIIDTMGAYFRGTSLEVEVDGNKRKIQTASEHFLILNHEKLFNLRLTDLVITDFYSKYRSVSTHNNTLPPFMSMDKGDKADDIFIFNNDGKKIKKLMLIPLFESVQKANRIFSHYLKFGNWSEDHQLAKELLKKSGEVEQTPVSPGATGLTMEQRFNLSPS